MSEEPERIWTFGDRFFVEQHDCFDPITEYVRADLLADMTRQRDEAREEGFDAGLEAAAKVAKSAWLTTNIGTIGDAVYAEELCHELSNTIRALAEGAKP